MTIIPIICIERVLIQPILALMITDLPTSISAIKTNAEWGMVMIGADTGYHKEYIEWKYGMYATEW